ncbi:MAG: chemotaxis protein CheW [Gammaproteobacteria bacterium]
MAIDLVRFQEDLISRIRAVEDAAPVIPWLGVQTGGQHWLVEVGSLTEVLPVPSLLNVPHTVSWFAGIANIRGNLYSIADLTAFLRRGGKERGASARVLLLRSALRCGLIVDNVLGLYNPAQWTLKNERSTTLVMAEYLDNQSVLWRALDLPALEKHTSFLSVAA